MVETTARTVGIIGVGEIATFLVQGLTRAAAAGRAMPALVLSPRGRERAAVIARETGATIAADNAEVVERGDLVIVATRPAQTLAAISGLPWREGQVLLSVVAGVQVEKLASAAAPATIVRSIPVTCSALGLSPTAMWPDEPRAHDLLARLGTVHPMPDEAAFEAACVLGAFYGWVYALVERATETTAAAGVPASEARAIVAGMVGGAAAMVRHRPEVSVEHMLAELATPGGVTRLGLDVLARHEALDAWDAAWRAVHDRLRGT